MTMTNENSSTDLQSRLYRTRSDYDGLARQISKSARSIPELF